MWTLLRHLWVLEWRTKYRVYNSLLYALSTSFIASLVVSRYPGVSVWSGLMWFLMLFNAITACSDAFRNEGERRHIFYRQLSRPEDIFFSRFLFHGLFGLLLVCLQFGLLCFFIGAPSAHWSSMFLHILIGSVSLMGVLSLTSAIAAMSGNNVSMMAVLSFPLLIPVLMIGLEGTLQAGLGDSLGHAWKFAMGNTAMGGLVAALGYLLFPYLWNA